jgi:hypothetical protein
MTTNGLVFSATQDPSQLSGTGSSNTLDAYEEGTWSPALSGTVNYSTQTGRYVKTGAMIDVMIEMTVASCSGQSNSHMSVPFTFAAEWYCMVAVWNIATNFTGSDRRFGGHGATGNFNMQKMQPDNENSAGEINHNVTGRYSYGLTYKSTT